MVAWVVSFDRRRRHIFALDIFTDATIAMLDTIILLFAPLTQRIVSVADSAPVVFKEEVGYA